VEKTPNSICFPDDDGVDSLSKTFNLSRESGGSEFYEDEVNHRFDGNFRLLDGQSGDSVDIRIERLRLGKIQNFLGVLLII